MAARPRRVANRLGREHASRREGPAKLDVLVTPVLGVTLEIVDPQAKPAVPLDRARQLARDPLHLAPAVARVQDQCLDVAREQHRSVDLRFDVVVEQVLFVGFGQRNERHAGAVPNEMGSKKLSG